MAKLFAKLDENNVVMSRILLDEGHAATEAKGIEWLKNHYGHTNWKECSRDGSIRKNDAANGNTYDAGRDAFIRPKPYPSWILNESTCKWEAPSPQPADYTDDAVDPDFKISYVWDESSVSWVKPPNYVEGG